MATAATVAINSDEGVDSGVWGGLATVKPQVIPEPQRATAHATVAHMPTTARQHDSTRNGRTQARQPRTHAHPHSLFSLSINGHQGRTRGDYLPSVRPAKR